METTEHFTALMTGLSHEKARLANEKTEKGKELRRVWVSQIEKEIESEVAFLESKGIHINLEIDSTMTDDELMAALLA